MQSVNLLRVEYPATADAWSRSKAKESATLVYFNRCFAVGASTNARVSTAEGESSETRRIFSFFVRFWEKLIFIGTSQAITFRGLWTFPVLLIISIAVEWCADTFRNVVYIIQVTLPLDVIAIIIETKAFIVRLWWTIWTLRNAYCGFWRNFIFTSSQELLKKYKVNDMIYEEIY